MKRRLLIVAALCAAMLVGLAGPAGAYSNNFDTDTDGWFDNGAATITQQPSGYDSTGNLPYADDITSASDGFHARLGRGQCQTLQSDNGLYVNCSGPYTYWGDGTKYTWNGPYTTQVDIYLDTAYANANPDTFGGNYTELTTPNPSTDPTDIGTRFDFTSAINSSTPVLSDPNDPNSPLVGQHLRDFGFNVSTGYANDTCGGFMVTGQTVVNRNNANPNIGQHDPQCIDETGWYTFKHSFSEEAGYLKVVMEIIPVDPNSQETTKSWTITGIDPIENVGCNRYGWFSNQEIFGLPIDNASMTGGCEAQSEIDVVKFYDANANGLNDDSQPIDGWKINISGVGDFPAPVSEDVFAGDYTVSEYNPVETNWIHTTPTSVDVTVPPNASVEFGNLCLGAGGGKTLGFWSNKNGQAKMEDGGTSSPELALLSGLNLRNANGTAFNPTSYSQFKTWLLGATATNMSYMLSAQLASMALNVEAGFVDENSLVYAPGVPGANALGFISVGELMDEANTELGLDGITLVGDPERANQEAKKNALDKANNNMTFVQTTACTFSFTA
ncbi:MAG: hypothetical protein WB297_18210 [Actinomycetota bacterium]